MTTDTITISADAAISASIAANGMWRRIADETAETIKMLGNLAGDTRPWAVNAAENDVREAKEEGRDRGMPYLLAYRALCGLTTDDAAVREHWASHITMLLAPEGDDSGIA